ITDISSTGASLANDTRDCVQLGTENPGSNLPSGWLGWMDDISFWDSALSASDVQAHREAALVPWAGELPGERLVSALDAADINYSLATSVGNGEAALGPATIAGRDLWGYMQSVVETEGGRLFIDRAGQ